MAQRTINVCDACQSDDLAAGYAVITVSGDRAAPIKSRIANGRNALDLCDECAVSLGEWVAQRGRPKLAIEEAAPAKPAAEAVSSAAPSFVSSRRSSPFASTMITKGREPSGDDASE